MQNITGLVEGILTGNEKSAARLITRVENGDREAYGALSLLLPHTGRAHIVGVTGPAGAGKSTLVGRLAVYFSKHGKNVGIIATDPTSIAGKGAFLGDRVRMKEAEKQNIFIRSMAHRAYPGGIAKAATAAAYIMEALGKDCIIVESIGAGQSEKDLFFLCDTVITLFTPDYGDEIQLLKAGLIEIGDVIVVNKSDKPGADDAVRDISVISSLKAGSNGWNVPILLTRADQGEGVDDLVRTIEEHWRSLSKKEKRLTRKKQQTEAFLMALLKEEAWKVISARLVESPLFKKTLRDIRSGKTDPYSAVERLLTEMEEQWTLR